MGSAGRGVVDHRRRSARVGREDLRTAVQDGGGGKHRLVLRELPTRQKIEFAIYGALVTFVIAAQLFSLAWALWGVWLYDFVTYYHDRPERMRHLYAVTKTLDELRDFRAPWAWALPCWFGRLSER